MGAGCLCVLGVWGGGGEGVIFGLWKSQGGNSLGDDAEKPSAAFRYFFDVAVH